MSGNRLRRSFWLDWLAWDVKEDLERYLEPNGLAQTIVTEFTLPDNFSSSDYLLIKWRFIKELGLFA